MGTQKTLGLSLRGSRGSRRKRINRDDYRGKDSSRSRQEKAAAKPVDEFFKTGGEIFYRPLA